MLKSRIVACLLLIGCTLAWNGCPSPSAPGPTLTATLAPLPTIDFGRVTVGKFKDSSIRLTNTGNDTLRITSHNFTSSDFMLADTSQTTLKIAPGSFADVSLRFAPKDSSSITAYDTIKSNALPVAITLMGGGIALIPVIILAPSIDFGNARLGVCANSLLGAPRDTTVSVQNTGNDTLRISSVMPQAAVFSVISFDPVIAPGASGSIQVRFCPSQIGTASATAIVSSNATQNPSLTITLTGNGVPYTPGVGSTFNYTAVKIDTLGTPQGNPYSVNISILTTGLNYQGKTNVSESSDSTYFKIEDNGDVSVYSAGFPTYPASNLVGNGWLTLPFGSQGQNLLLLSNDQTFLDSAGNSIMITVRDSASYAGSSNVTVSGTQYSVSHIHLLEEALYTATKGARALVIGSELYYSPVLGFTVSQASLQEDITFVAGNKKVKSNGEERTLKNFQEQ